MPLREVVVFPHVVIPLLVGRPASLAAVEAAIAGDQYLLLVAQESGEVQDPAASDLFRVGVIGRVLQFARMPGGTAKVLVEGLARARVTRYLPSAKLLRAAVAPYALAGETPAVESRQAMARFEEYVALHRRIPDEVVALVQAIESDERRAMAIAAHLVLRHDAKQALLDAETAVELWTALGRVLGAEIELLRLERKIDDDVRGSLFQNQREFYLQEQLRAINRELGQDEGDDLGEVEAEITKRGLPEPVAARARRELRKLRRTAPMSPETTVGRNYLDWLLSLPWTARTDDVLDVEHARTVLDQDHYGLEDVKDRILDYIAVLALVGRLEGPILCLVGPPGVGKTSLGQSVARALGRRFVRMSLGGVRDEAEIRGHRRTYIGALPGRIIQAMKRAEVVNPVILLDEIDKLGADYRGDPAAALLEVLDPEQNRAFNDHYLELDYDLSQVLFITTANSLQTIPEPLRDRMEILRLSGYLDHEKLAIARQFLVPRQLARNGLAPESVTWASDALPGILRGYTREAGVRELDRRIARVARKLARRRAEAAPADTTAVVQASDLKALLGPAPFDPDDLSFEDVVGVARGLAYTSFGGETLDIEVSVVRGRGKLQLTGTLGDVMKESASAALSYARRRAKELGIDRDFYRNRDIHVHIPAGATPKDGPSAGIAIATAIVSALTRRAVRGDIAMTGEVTLRGRVLPIGGLKEKAVAAHRAGVRHIIVPYGNEREIEELPEEVRQSVTFHAVKSMDDVLVVALRAAPPAPAPTVGPKRGAKTPRIPAPSIPAPVADTVTH
ncbi:MAG TPA: endopeptidase La [Gemmatimonadaceae bacterium]|nr:endopeptidase La [Gemmatimonadaceae bacterium]